MGDIQPARQFQAFLLEGRFMIQRSRDGGKHVFYPRVAEPGTGAELEWAEASGNGTVYATTVVRAKPPNESYNIALVDLQEGVRMMSRVEGILPTQVSIGMKVKARIRVDEGVALVVFDPA
jgi:uncharacterized OB-fold protein